MGSSSYGFCHCEFHKCFYSRTIHKIQPSCKRSSLFPHRLRNNRENRKHEYYHKINNNIITLEFFLHLHSKMLKVNNYCRNRQYYSVCNVTETFHCWLKLPECHASVFHWKDLFSKESVVLHHWEEKPENYWYQIFIFHGQAEIYWNQAVWLVWKHP